MEIYTIEFNVKKIYTIIFSFSDNLEKRIGHSSTENSPKHKMEDRLNPNFSQKSSSDIALIEPEVRCKLTPTWWWNFYF